MKSARRFDDQYLVENKFEQRICSPHRDVGSSNNRRRRSLSPLNAARHARHVVWHRDWVKGEENAEDNFDDCRVSADCFVDGSVRSRVRTSRQSAPPRPCQLAVPRHQRLRGAGGVVGPQLQWWIFGAGRSLIPAGLTAAGILKGRAGRR